MGKVVFSISFIISILFSTAQGTLQFNQVLSYAEYPGNSHTVPLGKVWKIESIDCNPNVGYQLNLNGISVSYSILYNNSAFYFTTFPIWLKANDVYLLPQLLPIIK
jgi:hypothetical protein